MEWMYLLRARVRFDRGSGLLLESPFFAKVIFALRSPGLRFSAFSRLYTR